MYHLHHFLFQENVIFLEARQHVNTYYEENILFKLCLFLVVFLTRAFFFIKRIQQ